MYSMRKKQEKCYLFDYSAFEDNALTNNFPYVRIFLSIGKRSEEKSRLDGFSTENSRWLRGKEGSWPKMVSERRG